MEGCSFGAISSICAVMMASKSSESADGNCSSGFGERAEGLAGRNLSRKSVRGALFVSITRRRQTEFTLESPVKSGFRFVTNILGDFRNAA
jgi:hypothetical protein